MSFIVLLYSYPTCIFKPVVYTEPPAEYVLVDMYRQLAIENRYNFLVINCVDDNV